MSDVHLSMLCVLGKTMFVFKGSGKTCAAWVHNVLVDRRTRAAEVQNGLVNRRTRAAWVHNVLVDRRTRAAWVHNVLAIEELVQHVCTMCWQ